MNLIFLLLGTNEGNRIDFLKKAREQINLKIGITIKQSGIYETAAWGLTNQANYLNQIVLIESILEPLEILKFSQAIEKQLGRQRIIKWGARTIDIDLLYYNDAIIDLPNLQIPHPRLHERAFTLIPMVEIEPDLIHPQLMLSQKELFERCTDNLKVSKFEDLLAI